MSEKKRLKIIKVWVIVNPYNNQILDLNMNRNGLNKSWYLRKRWWLLHPRQAEIKIDKVYDEETK